MAINWTWPKATALTTVQSAASALVALWAGHDIVDISWLASFEAAGLTGVVTFLRAVVAYQLPPGRATALVSASVSAAQDAAAAAPDPTPVVVVGDAESAR